MASDTTKSGSSILLQASTARAAGAGATYSAWTEVKMGTSILARMTNGSTGPSVPANFTVEVADDVNGTNAYEFSRQSGPVGNNAVADRHVKLQFDDGLFFRTKFDGNAGQTVTVQARCHRVDKLVST